MKTKIVILALTGLGFAVSGRAQPSTTAQSVTRQALLSAHLAHAKSVNRVEIKSVTLDPGVLAGPHLHPVPVVGVVTAGSILFQIEGFAEQHLHAGDAFFEPADVRILHFDNGTSNLPATFVAFYLLGDADHDLIHMLKKE